MTTTSVSTDRLPGSRPRSTGIFAVDMLPAENGDCLLIEYGDPGGPSRVLIDCGASSAVSAISRRLDAGRRHAHAFDLFILTHIDADHINGVLPLFEQSDLTLRFDDIWFNGWRQVSRFLGVRQAEAFSALLEDPSRQLPWNRAFSSNRATHPEPVAIPEGAAPPTVTLTGGMQLTVLSPGPPQLERLAKHWRTVLLELDPRKALLGRKRRPPPVTDLARFHLEPLAESPAKADASVANGSSIAVLAEFNGRSVLLAGDAHAEVLRTSIAALQRARGREGTRLTIDALKLSHHGSANATTVPLLEMLDCRHYLVSSNGNMFYHPDREAVARVILRGGDQPTLHFNYRTPYNELWDASALKRRYRYEARYPDRNEDGLRLDLPSRTRNHGVLPPGFPGQGSGREG